jgi:hypothetical protein
MLVAWRSRARLDSSSFRGPAHPVCRGHVCRSVELFWHEREPFRLAGCVEAAVPGGEHEILAEEHQRAARCRASMLIVRG